MNATTFAKRKAKIESLQEKPAWWRRKAHNALIREAHAVVVIGGGKVVAHQLPNGEMVCIKRRFKNEGQALETLGQIAMCDRRDHAPIRAYPCPSCHGWHVTSEAKR